MDTLCARSQYIVSEFYIWEGVYNSFAEIPESVDPHQGGRWLESLQKRTDDVRLGRELAFNQKILPVVVGTNYSSQDTVKILDFGGGLGRDYYNLLQAELKPKIQYSVVEITEVVNFGKSYNDGLYSDICFLDSIPENESYDIVSAHSVIHYCMDWKSILLRLGSLNAELIVYEDVLCGAFDTFASKQNYYESYFPCWFFNEKEFIGIVEECGYELSYRGKFLGQILGKLQKPPMGNFEEHQRMDYASNFVFRRIK